MDMGDDLAGRVAAELECRPLHVKFLGLNGMWHIAAFWGNGNDCRGLEKSLWLAIRGIQEVSMYEGRAPSGREAMLSLPWRADCVVSGPCAHSEFRKEAQQ